MDEPTDEPPAGQLEIDDLDETPFVEVPCVPPQQAGG